MGKLQSLFPFKRRTEKKADRQTDRRKKTFVVFVSVRFLFLSVFLSKKKKKNARLVNAF